MNNALRGSSEMVSDFTVLFHLKIIRSFFLALFFLAFCLNSLRVFWLCPLFMHTHARAYTFTEKCWEISKSFCAIIFFQRGRKMRGFLFTPLPLFQSFHFFSQTSIPQSSISLLTVTTTFKDVSIAVSIVRGNSLRPPLSEQCVSATVPRLNTDRHVWMSIFSVVLKRMIASLQHTPVS